MTCHHSLATDPAQAINELALRQWADRFELKTRGKAIEQAFETLVGCEDGSGCYSHVFSSCSY